MVAGTHTVHDKAGIAFALWHHDGVSTAPTCIAQQTNAWFITRGCSGVGKCGVQRHLSGGVAHEKQSASAAMLVDSNPCLHRRVACDADEGTSVRDACVVISLCISIAGGPWVAPAACTARWPASPAMCTLMLYISVL